MTDQTFNDLAWLAFDPLAPVPADDPEDWFQELSEARNDRHFRQQIARQLRRQPERPPRYLLLGHPGTGKSTELARLRRELEDQGFLCVIAEVDRDLDKKDVALVEVQLLLIERIGETLRERDLRLPDELLGRLNAWFHEVETVRETAATGAVEVGVGLEPNQSLMGRLFGLVLPTARAEGKVSVDRRKTVREKAQRRLRDFVDLLASLVGSAADAARSSGRLGLILIVDGLEKVAPEEQGPSRAARILLDGSEQWAQLPAPLVFTAPLDLLAENHRLENHFNDKFLISAVPVAARPDQPAPEAPLYVRNGREALRRLVERRAPVAKLFADPADFERLLDSSGGSIRDLFRLLRKAIDEAEPGQAIDGNATSRALRYFAEDLQLILQPEDLDPLRALAEKPEALHYNSAGVALLRRELVLPYVNGGRWFGVHPAIRKRVLSP